MSGKSESLVRSLAKGSGILIAGLGIELGLSFFAKLLMAQLLGRTNYGTVSIGIIAAANLSTILLLGMHTGVARYLPRFDDTAARRGVVLSAYRVTVPLSLLAAGLLFWFADPIARRLLTDPGVAPVLRVFALGVPFAVFMKLAIGAVRGAQTSFPKVVIRNITQPVVRFTLIAVVLGLGFGAIGVAWAYVAAYAIAAAVGTYYVVRHTPVFADVTPRPMTREVLKYSLPLGMTGVTTLVFSGIGIDTYLIAYFQTTGDVGDYNVAFPVAKLITVAFSAFSFLFLPVISELHASEARRELQRLFKLLTKWVFLLTLPVAAVFVVFPGEVIAMTFGEEYTAASTALAVLSIGFFVHSVAGPNQGVLEAVGHTRTILLDNVAAAVTNIVANVVLIPRVGIMGAAIGTTLGYTVLNGAYAYHVYRIEGLHPLSRALVRPATGAGVLVGGLYAAGRYVAPSGPMELVSVVLAFGVIYTVVVLRLGGIEEEEVMLVLSFEDRFGVDLGPLKGIGKRVMGTAWSERFE